MKLVRHGSPGAERPGILDAHGITRDLSGVIGDIAGDVLTKAGLDQLREIDTDALSRVPAGTRFGPPVGAVGKFICVGLNYADHAAETGAPTPEQPILFMKATTAICGPNDDILIPPGAEKVDWEVELGVVIGDMARNITEADAMAYVAGYCLIHDVSERAFQLEHGGQWVKGKSYDSFGPMGPFLATPDEIANVGDLAMTLSVNGVVRQSGTTANMIFRVPALVSTISRYMTLMPGDVVSTGTPAGVGLGLKPPEFLHQGDIVELSIAGLGSQRQAVVNDRR